MAAVAAAESPLDFQESPMEETDAIYPCKGCGDILEEGKAFELAGNRWHIECFRCNTCGTLLDSDANLLLLGDGSLICNNCTYSCNACGNKIEDLAILTGDQAFCAACFRCRNCKRKIENLRYARTSQGIFCMRCHESLMERRRKKQKSAKAASTSSGPPAVLDKSLPALPPGLIPSATFDPNDRAAEGAGRPASSRGSTLETLLDSTARDYSPASDERKGNTQTNRSPNETLSETLTLPASTYGESRYSTISSAAQSDLDDSSGFLPMAFDPTPTPPSGATPRPVQSQTKETLSRDYFNPRTSSKPSHRDLLRDAPPSRSASSERETKPTSPYQNLQDKTKPTIKRKEVGEGTDGSTTAPAAQSRSRSHTQTQQTAAPDHLSAGDAFKLQDAPRTRKGSIRTEAPDLRGDADAAKGAERTPSGATKAFPPNEAPSPDSGFNPFDDPKLHDALNRHPARGDSLSAAARKPVAPLAADRSKSEATGTLEVSTHLKSSSTTSPTEILDQPRANKSLASPLGINMEIPPRAASRPSAPSKSVANDDFMAPRTAPVAPTNGHERRNGSVTSFVASPDALSPKATAHVRNPSLGENFSMEEEVSRIIGRKGSTVGAESSAPSVLRKVSNAVRHGRSFSDRAIPSAQKTPTSSQLEISSPLLTSPGSPSGKDEASVLRGHLRRAQQRIAELESEKRGMIEKLDGTGDLKQVNTELREKRSTMAFLDTQREMVVRELEVMTEHLTHAKDTNRPLDLPALKTDIMQDFTHSLQRLKETLGSQIEDLVHRRNELTDEIANLIQVKDKGLQEFENISSKNTQLTELNSQLVHNIQDMYKANRLPNGGSMSDLRASPIPSIIERESASVTSLRHPPPDLGEAQLLGAPQVVNIRKGVQPKKFNWKKGGNVAKNVARNVKGAFAKDGQYDINGNPIGPPLMLSSSVTDSASSRTAFTSDSDKSRLAFFSSQKNGLKPDRLGNGLGLRDSGSTHQLVVDPSILFGSDLSARCEYEKRVLPAVVTRCVEEVEARGMDVEGIYRKSGGAGQVKAIQAGFERDGAHNISDAELDIHAVTSCLKQYFRKLPDPLITFDVYESVLEAAQLPEVEKRGLAMKIALGNLAPCHRDVLEYLVAHLARVVEKESLNLMTPLNISVVFAPTIMRSISIEREMTDMQAQREAVRTILDHGGLIFD